MPPHRNPKGPEDRTAAYQAVGGVTDYQTYNGYGRWESEPGDGD